MEITISTILVLIGPVALLIASWLWPDWLNARRWTTIGITAALVAGIIVGSWAWAGHNADIARRNTPIIAIDPAERTRMDAGAGLKY